MVKRVGWDLAKIVKFREMWDSGLTNREIGGYFGCTASNIRQRANHFVFPNREILPQHNQRSKRLDWTFEKRAKLRKMFSAGVPLNDIGKEFGCSASNISARMKRAGFTPRSPGVKRNPEREAIIDQLDKDLHGFSARPPKWASEKLNVSVASIYNMCKRRGIECRLNPKDD